MSNGVGARVDDIDVQLEKVRRLIDGASDFDPELAAGMATTQSLNSIERHINQACAAGEDLASHLRAVVRNRR